jgi:hypothetical protein
MKKSGWTLQAVCLVGLLCGCTSIFPQAPVTVTPLLGDPADGPLLWALVHEQDQRIEACEARKSCPPDLYLKGLLALFHSREQAMATFQQVKALAPHSRYFLWSTSWIDFLQASPSAHVSKVTEDLVWEVLERELSETPNEPMRTLWSDRFQRVGALESRPAISPEHVVIPEGKDPATLHALRKRLRERERTLTERDHQIAVLTSQLNALKQIDHETQTKRRALQSSK